MPNIETIIRSINKELVPQFEEKLRQYLIQQDKEWLVEQIIRLSLDAHSLKEMDRKSFQEAKTRKRADRAERVQAMALNEAKLAEFIAAYKPYNRQRLLEDGYLINNPPEQGKDLIGPQFRSQKGETILTIAKDTLFALLFGDGSLNVEFQRTQRELLTIMMPRFKSDALDFMQAATELSAHGTWNDPESVSNDSRADNTIMEVEFGETASENISKGIGKTLSLINYLEINEQILYARIENIEQSSLVD
jgi:hypothetical protein